MYLRRLLAVLVLLCCDRCCFAWTNVYPKLKHVPIKGGDTGEPLILTPYIEAKKITEARKLSAVSFADFMGVNSYSGYLTVNATYNSNLFFWFFPAQKDYENAPVLLWLQGGPGATSLFGLFFEHGPFEFVENGNLQLRKYSWIKRHSVLYIDNPAGTGFSFTESAAGYATDQTDVGENLYRALLQFFQLFPELQKNDFFVTGESYAGKYVPACSYAIHKHNPDAAQKINLKGFAIGNGLSDPEHQLKYSDYLYQLGLIDVHVKEYVAQVEDETVQLIRNGDYFEAFTNFDELLNGDLTNATSYFTNVTGFANYFNFLVANNTDRGEQYMTEYLSRADVRKAIHVGNRPFDTEDKTVEIHLVNDVMKSVAPWVAELLAHYRGLIYNGQLDIIVAYPLTVRYLQQLAFDAADEYKTAPRFVWRVDGEVAGYAKHAGNLVEVLVRNAGHMVPHDQPRWAYELITRFVTGKSLS